MNRGCADLDNIHSNAMGRHQAVKATNRDGRALSTRKVTSSKFDRGVVNAQQDRSLSLDPNVAIVKTSDNMAATRDNSTITDIDVRCIRLTSCDRH